MLSFRRHLAMAVPIWRVGEFIQLDVSNVGLTDEPRTNRTAIMVLFYTSWLVIIYLLIACLFQREP